MQNLMARRARADYAYACRLLMCLFFGCVFYMASVDASYGVLSTTLCGAFAVGNSGTAAIADIGLLIIGITALMGKISLSTCLIFGIGLAILGSYNIILQHLAPGTTNTCAGGR